jgi:glyoxylase I family protein
MGMKPGKNCIDIGMVVKDIDKSLAFYQDLLGLEKIGEMPLWFGTMHRMGFGGSFVKIIDPNESLPPVTQGLDKALGFRYLTFQVTNIDEVCEDCEKAGTPFDITKRELMPGVTIAMVQDPDGNVVEFVQRA